MSRASQGRRAEPPEPHIQSTQGLLSNRLTSFTRVSALGEDVRHAEEVPTGVQEGRGHGRPAR